MDKDYILYLKDKDIWTDDDIQIALDYLNFNSIEKNKLIKYINDSRIKDGSDFIDDESDLISCIEYGKVSGFNMFDSVLKDYFWYYFNKYILNKETFKGSLFEKCYEDKNINLTESPDKYGLETDDEIDSEMQAEIERIKSKYNSKKIDINKERIDKELEEKELEDKKEAELLINIKNKLKSCKNIDDLFDLFVPSSGPAETIGGEIVRALSKLAYRWYNDGDMYFLDIDLNSCTNCLAYLLSEVIEKHLPVTVLNIHQEFINIMDKYEYPGKDILSSHYDNFIKKLIEDITSYLLGDGAFLFTLPNTEDMLKADTEDLLNDLPLYSVDIYYDQNYPDVSYLIDQIDLLDLIKSSYMYSDGLLDQMYISFGEILIDDLKPDEYNRAYDEISKNLEYLQKGLSDSNDITDIVNFIKENDLEDYINEDSLNRLYDINLDGLVESLS